MIVLVNVGAPRQLARHYREQENLTIAEIARRLGRAEATVKAYLYDTSKHKKSSSSQEQAASRPLVRAPASRNRRCEPARAPAPRLARRGSRIVTLPRPRRSYDRDHPGRSPSVPSP